MKCFGLKNNSPLNNNKKTSLSSLNLNKNLKQLEPNSTSILSESPLTKNFSTVLLSNKNIVPSLSKKIESITKKKPKSSNIKKFYVYAPKANISTNIKDVLHIKEVFPSLSADEVEKVIKAKNSSEGQKKTRINMTTSRPLQKQVIIPMAKLNAKLIINSATQHIANINKCLENIKSDFFADFIYVSNNRVTITINKLANVSNLTIIEKYIKYINNINSDFIESP